MQYSPVILNVVFAEYSCRNWQDYCDVIVLEKLLFQVFSVPSKIAAKNARPAFLTLPV